MQNRSLARFAFIIALTTSAALGARAQWLCAAHERHAPDDEPYVQVTSVTMEPPTIHKDRLPDTTTVIVQIMLRGEAPSGSTARVDVGTYSADPPENKVSYGEQSQTVPLKEKVTVVKFAARTTSQTLPGKVIVAATIFETTKGVKIKQPESHKDWTAELITAVP